MSSPQKMKRMRLRLAKAERRRRKVAKSVAEYMAMEEQRRAKRRRGWLARAVSWLFR